VVLGDATRLLVENALPEGVALVDLGEHRLKDLARPERIWQLSISGLPSEFPALKSLDYVPNNLPTQMTSFVGRDHELEEARALLARARLLTLTGPGGTGKTRLSLQLAAEASEDFKHGVYWVPLAPITDPDLVPSAIAQSLGVQEAGQQTARDVLLGYLKDRQVLLVLDNFEQILAAAPVVAEILQSAPQVKVVTSSRAPLRVYGEQEYAVPPLGVPDVAHLPPLAALSQYEAVKLFIERAMSVKPDFAVTNENAPAVAQITALVDGLPLAVELAAARIRLMPPQAILKRLEGSLADLAGGARDLPARQQTLRGAIAWSYDLLDEPTRRLFARFAVFTAGGSLGHVEDVCGPAEELGVDIMDGLESLVQHSLLRTVDDPDEVRFLMLHVIREYALERLAESPDAEQIRRRHADAMLAEVEDAAPHLLESDSRRWLDHLEIEQANIRAAMSFFIDRDEAEPALRIAASAWRFWQIRGHATEGSARTDEALALPGAQDHPRAMMGALEAAGGLAWWRNVDMAACLRYYERALEMARASGSRKQLADALYNVFFPAYVVSGVVDRSREVIEEARSAYGEIGDEIGLARSAWALASLHVQLKEYPEALRLSEESTARFRKADRTFDLLWGLHMVGTNAIRTGDLERGRSALREGLELLHDTGDLSGIAIFLDDFADLELAAGNNNRAARLIGAALTARDKTGAGLAGNESALARFSATDYMSAEELEAGMAEGRLMGIEQAIAFALA
jgi:predicted ATPase